MKNGVKCSDLSKVKSELIIHRGGKDCRGNSLWLGRWNDQEFSFAYVKF